MAIGHLLAAPDRVVHEIESTLGCNGISYELEHEKECDHGRHVLNLTSFVCSTEETQVSGGIEKRRRRNGAYIVLIPERRAFFRRDHNSKRLAEKIVNILSSHGATDNPRVSCEDLGQPLHGPEPRWPSELPIKIFYYGRVMTVHFRHS